jgi:indole-3-glycerol phosphate synthase
MDWLETIVKHRRAGLAALQARRGEWKNAAPALRPGRFRQALQQDGIQVIAEIKRASPSRGMLAPDLDPEALACAYRDGGAAALSVLTEEEFFRARPEDLQRAAHASGLPVLRKDFLVDPLQIQESLAMGADAVLLIAAALPGQHLAEMAACAREAGLDALLEVHHADELSSALDAGATLVGVNCRDLRSFTVDLTRAEEMARLLPGEVVRVAESGISGPADVGRMRDAGFDAVLVGEFLVRAGDPVRALQELRS